jgi:hypothetical protein
MRVHSLWQRLHCPRCNGVGVAGWKRPPSWRASRLSAEDILDLPSGFTLRADGVGNPQFDCTGCGITVAAAAVPPSLDDNESYA